jgi:hypothetical protein
VSIRRVPGAQTALRAKALIVVRKFAISDP